jgi:hypothetical protein
MILSKRESTVDRESVVFEDLGRWSLQAVWWRRRSPYSPKHPPFLWHTHTVSKQQSLLESENKDRIWFWEKTKWKIRGFLGGWTPSLTFGALIHSIRAGTVLDALLIIEYSLGLGWAGLCASERFLFHIINPTNFVCLTREIDILK